MQSEHRVLEASSWHDHMVYVDRNNHDLTPTPRLPLDHYVIDEHVDYLVRNLFKNPEQVWGDFATIYSDDARAFFSTPYCALASNKFGYRGEPPQDSLTGNAEEETSDLPVVPYAAARKAVPTTAEDDSDERPPRQSRRGRKRSKKDLPQKDMAGKTDDGKDRYPVEFYCDRDLDSDDGYVNYSDDDLKGRGKPVDPSYWTDDS